jgi:hypothetical protein
MIEAPLASSRFTTSGMVVGTPAGGVGFASVRAMEATIPSKVTVTVFALPATIVAEVVLCDNGGPVPLSDAYIVSANVSVPTGALSVTEHVRPPLGTGVQFGDPGARLVTTERPPLTEIATDCVLTET